MAAHLDSLIFELTGSYPIEFEDFAHISKAIRVPVKVLHQWASGKAPDWLLPVILRAKAQGVADSVEVLEDGGLLDPDSNHSLSTYYSDLMCAVDSSLSDDAQSN